MREHYFEDAEEALLTRFELEPVANIRETADRIQPRPLPLVGSLLCLRGAK
jgi:hypothetical protein